MLSLRSAVIMVVLVPLLAVFGAGGLLVLTALERQLEARLQEDIALISRALKVPLARSLEREREYSLDRALRSASEFSRVYGVYLYDAKGTLISRADQLPNVSMPSLTDLDVQSVQETAEYRSVGGREVYSYFTPLTDAGGQTIGMLQITRRASEIRDYLDALRVNAGLVMLGFCALFIAIVILGHHLAIGRPLGYLADAMGLVAAGDKTVRASARGPLEVRWLAARFNRMLDGMAERDRVLSKEKARKINLENRLRQSEKYALAGRLASGVAHELGAPLSVVDGHAQQLMRRGRLDSKEHGMLAGIRASAARMAAIVQQLLGFGREPAVALEQVSVRRIITLALADVRAQTEGTDAEIQLVAGPADAQILGDEGRLREALAHLLRNALYAADGGQVRIGWERNEDDTRVFVENSGKPIPTSHRERIFEPFFTTKQAGHGSGLGLAIVKGTVADHGAEITVYDVPLGGAGFRIDFPPEHEASE